MSQRDTQDAEGFLLAAPHRHDDVGGARHSRVARGPGGHGDAGHVEGHEDGLGAGGWQGQVDDRARRGRLPHRRVRAVRQAAQQVGAQGCRALGESGALGHRLGEGGGERAGTRDVGCARADRTLVTAAGTVGRHGDATPGEKDANADGRADLVPAHTHEVEAKLCE